MAGLINVILGIVTGPFKRGLADAKKDTDKFKKDTEKGGGLFGAIGGKLGGALAGIAITSQIKGLIDLGGEIQDAAGNAGVGVEAMQRLQGAFADSGARAETVTKGIAELSQAMSQALDGNEEMIETLDNLGISLDDIIKNADNPEEMFFKLAEGFSKAEDKGKALEDLQKVLGKSAKTMAAGLRGGGDELRKAFNGSLIATKDQIEAVDTLGDKMGEFTRKAKAMGLAVIGGLAGAKGASAGLRELGQGESAPDKAAKAVEEQEKKRQQALAESRRREQQAQAQRRKDNAAREKVAEENLKQEQRKQQTLQQEAAGVSGRTQVGDVRRRIREAAAQAATGSAEGRANLAAALSDRAAQLTNENLMTPNERREARRADGRLERARNKAQRQLEKEAPEAVKQIKTTDNAQLKAAVEETNKTLEQIKSSVTDLIKGGMK